MTRLQSNSPAVGAALLAALSAVLIGCGGSSSSSPTGSQNTGNTGPAVKYGGHPLGAAQRPTSDMPLSTSQALPVGTVVAVALDRNNPVPTYYTAKVMGFDALDQLVWMQLTADVATPAGAGDSGTPVYTLSTPTASGQLIGSLSYGSSDNQVDFLVTPISLIRATGGASSKAALRRPATVTFKGKTFHSLSTPIYYSGVPAVVFNHMKARAGKASLVQNMLPAPVVAGASARQGVSKATDTTDPLFNNTIMTFLVHGDVVFDGATGSVTAADSGGWLGYGHPLDGAGPVDLGTCSGTVVNMFLEPVDGTYKLANPTNIFDKTMTWDGINGIRILPQAPKEVTVTTNLVQGKTTKTFTHYLGYDGIAGDQSVFLTETIEAAYLTFYDVEVDLVGSAKFTITTTIKGVTSQSTFEVPATSTGIFFGTDPNNLDEDTLDDEIYGVMSTVEASGDRQATVKVSATITLS